MTVRWEDVNARARGLSTHLLPRERLEEIARAPDLAALSARMEEAGLSGAEAAGGSAAELDFVARREVGRRLQVLARWLGSRVEVAAVIFDDEDRQSLRAILRGAAAGLPAEARLAGVLPTPALPERALEELAAREQPRDVAMLLSLWRHPFGQPLLEAIDPEHPDLTRMELALHAAFAARASRQARRGGPRLREFVRETIDLLNADAALILAGIEHELNLETVFLPGGHAISRDTWLHAASAASRAEAAERLRVALSPAGYGSAIRLAATDPLRFERELLERRVRHWHLRARMEPLGPAPVIEYLLRLRRQLLSLRELIWATALGVPAEQRVGRLLPA